jgi:hypothetical protein
VRAVLRRRAVTPALWIVVIIVPRSRRDAPARIIVAEQGMEPWDSPKSNDDDARDQPNEPPSGQRPGDGGYDPYAGLPPHQPYGQEPNANPQGQYPPQYGYGRQGYGEQGYYGAYPSVQEDPTKILQIPAIILLILAVMTMLGFGCISVSAQMLLSGAFEGPEFDEARGAYSDADIQMGVYLYGVAAFGQLVMALAAVFLMMRKNYALCISASILALVPCLGSPCFVIGIPFGIWALILLLREDVRYGFRLRSS